MIAAASNRKSIHPFREDIDRLKLTDFKTEFLFDLVDGLYRQKHGLTVTGNYSMGDPVERERLHPAIEVKYMGKPLTDLLKEDWKIQMF